jgi:dihydroorotate dehydrogenase electron transfer subunit
MVGGGMGVVPLVFLAQQLSRNGAQKLAFLGAQDKTKLVGKKELQKYGFVVYTATLDGSAGAKKDVVSLLKQRLASVIKKGESVVFGCGPYGMARNLQAVLKKYKIKSWFSFETIVACGLGLCRGCVIDTHSGYKLLCQDGPIFNLAEVKFSPKRGGVK